MADGSIVFETKLDNQELDQELRKTKQKIIKTYDNIQAASTKKNLAVEQIKQAEAEMDKLRYAGRWEGDNFVNTQDNVAKIDELYQRIESLKSSVKKYEAELENSNVDLDLAKEKAGLLEKELAKAANEADEVGNKTKKSSKAMEQLEKRTRRFGTRMREIVSGALFFNLISSGIRGMVNWMGTMVKSNDEAASAIGRLKGALLTLAQPILSVVIPAFVSLVNILTRVISAIASVVSRLFGTTAQKSADAAKKLNQQTSAYKDVGQAAKEASKSIMGFDELNVLQGDTEAGSAGGGAIGGESIDPNFDTVLSDEIQEQADRITEIVCAAIFALGAILAFSGANIPLGIGMMVIGALGMYAVASLNWDTMNKEVKKAITTLMVTLGLSLLVIGAVLAFSGAKIGLGIGLMALGAAALGGAIALNWSFLTDNVQYVIATILGVLAAGLLVIGAILLFTGHPVLGLGLMIAGGLAMWGAGAALNWDYAKEKLMEAWSGIKNWFSTNVAPKLTLSYWIEKLRSIGDAASDIGESIQGGFLGAFYNTIAGFSDFLATILEGLQWLVDQAAKVFSFIGSTSSLGQAFSNGYVAPASASLYSVAPAMASIPYLAQGAVIPPNREFLAVLGDQSHGTNIEAPLETIKQAVAEVMGEDYDLMREQNDLLRKILAKTGTYLDGKETAAWLAPYQRDMGRSRGW